METDLLRGFATVANTRSFTAASDRLPISQSGLSQQVRRLERLLGVKLLDRTTKSVSLTDAGRTLLPHVERLLANEDELLIQARALRTPGQREETLTIHVAEDGIGPVLVEIIEKTRAEIERLKVEVVQVSITEQATLLSEAKDRAALICRTPVAVDRPGRRSTLWTEPLVAVLPDPGLHGVALDRADLADRALRPMGWLPEEWLDWEPLLRGNQRGQEATMVVSSFRDAVHAVAIDRLACLAPESIAASVPGVGHGVVELRDSPRLALELVTLVDDSVTDALHEAATSAGAALDDDARALLVIT